MEIHHTLERMRAEFLEMPGLQVTLAQAQRLWNVDRLACKRILDRLVAVKFLRLVKAGLYARARDGAEPPTWPATAEREANSHDGSSNTSERCDVADVHLMLSSARPTTLLEGSAAHFLVLLCDTAERLQRPVALWNECPWPDAGTVIVEHVTRLSVDQQRRLSEMLATRPSTIQVIALSDSPNALFALVQRGMFLEALYYQLNVVRIEATTILAPS